LEEQQDKNLNISTLIKIAYKPNYSNLFNKIKGITSTVKNNILMTLLDGRWHTESDILRTTKKFQYMGAVTLATMIQSLNSFSDHNNFLEKKIVNDRIFYKLSENYVGLTRAAFTRFRNINQ